MNDFFDSNDKVAQLPPLHNATMQLNAKINIELATNNATIDLVSLSKKVLERNQCNKLCNMHATNELHSDETHTQQKSCTVALCKGGNYATDLKNNNQALHDKLEELRVLIYQIGKSVKEDPDYINLFADETIRNWSDTNRLESALDCFRGLHKQYVSHVV